MHISSWFFLSACVITGIFLISIGIILWCMREPKPQPKLYHIVYTRKGTPGCFSCGIMAKNPDGALDLLTKDLREVRFNVHHCSEDFDLAIKKAEELLDRGR